MNDWMNLSGALIVGFSLGLVFFGGLWWTVKRGTASPRPALWFVGSFVFRAAIILSGFYWIGNGSVERMGICLLGFILARWLVIQLTQKKSTPDPTAKEQKTEARYATESR